MKDFYKRISLKTSMIYKQKQESVHKNFFKLMDMLDLPIASNICAKNKLQLKNGRKTWKSFR